MATLVEQIRNAGIIGAGGAGFPTHVKMDAQVDTVIANGAECEPLLRVDQQVMVTHADEVVGGIVLAMEATGAAQGIIALKGKYKKAVAALEYIIKSHGITNIKVFQMGNYYPAGDEQVMVYDVTGRVIPEGGIPLQVNVVVSNVHTMMQIFYASQGQPVTWRYVTVGGAVKKPGTFKVPIGTSFTDLLALAGGTTIKEYSFVIGGPMMGKIGTDPQETVGKTTSGVLIMPSDHYVVTSKTSDIKRSIILARSACCQCTYCTQACPRNLLGHSIEPHKIMRAIAFGIADAALVENALYCVSCGLCTYYACPMGINPFRLCTEMRTQLLQQGIKPKAKKETYEAKEYAADRKVPVPLLMTKLNINQYNVDAPLQEELYEPQSVSLKLNQHIGAPATPVVTPGTKVMRGNLVADAAGKVSARVHASIDGTVVSVTENVVVISRT